MLSDKYRMNLMGSLKSIVLATDASEYSEGAIREAISFARACQTILTVLYVIEFNPEFETIGHKYVEEQEKNVARHFEWLREMGADENVECRVVMKRAEKPYEAIVEVAQEKKADLLVMGKHGRTGLKRLMMGSVTAKVIAYAPCKVLVVPKETEIRGENIMLATDGSKYSEAAENEAIAMSKNCPFVNNFIAVSVAKNKDKIAEAEHSLSQLRKKASAEGVKVDTLTLVGEPYKVIVNASLEAGTDIVIIGTHGRTGLSRLLMGSVAERVVGLTMCSVLVTKTHMG